MMVVHVIAHQAEQMLFVQHDNVVEDLAAATSHPSFREAILPRRLNTRPLRFETRCLQEGDDIPIEFRVVIQDGTTIRASLGKRFPQLLHYPIDGRMPSDVV